MTEFGFWETTLCDGRKAVSDVMWTSNLLAPPGAGTVRAITKIVPTENVDDLIVMIPGNPGVVDFYQKFVELINAQSNAKAAVVTVGYAGHHCHHNIPQRHRETGHWYALQDQIELIDSFIKAVVLPHLNRYPERSATRLHVAGHSIGSYVALHAAVRNKVSLDRVFLLTPTICNMRISPNGVLNKHMLSSPIIYAAALLGSMLGNHLPTAAQRVVLNIAEPKMDKQQQNVVIGMGYRGTVGNILTMAKSEFDQIATPDPHLVAMVDDMCVAYFVRHDGWVPMSDVKLWREHAPRATTILEDDCAVAHAWCLKHCQQVVDNAIAPHLPSLRVSS